jgi:hypothetical protein
MTTAPGVPGTAIFRDPPGIAAGLGTSTQDGDVCIYVELIDRQFMVLVLTVEDAIEFGLSLAEHVAEARRQREGRPARVTPG